MGQLSVWYMIVASLVPGTEQLKVNLQRQELRRLEDGPLTGEFVDHQSMT
jgi:hypothetical protein